MVLDNGPDCIAGLLKDAVSSDEGSSESVSSESVSSEPVSGEAVSSDTVSSNPLSSLDGSEASFEQPPAIKQRLTNNNILTVNITYPDLMSLKGMSRLTSIDFGKPNTRSAIIFL